MLKINQQEVNDVTYAIQDFYFSESPPPHQVLVDPQSIRPNKRDNTFFSAKVVIESNYVRLRRHRIHIHFKLNAYKRIIPSSISYITA